MPPQFATQSTNCRAVIAVPRGRQRTNRLEALAVNTHNAPGVDVQLTGFAQGPKAGRGGGRQPMTMDVPVGPSVTEESLALAGCQLLPQAGHG